jgi:hypothetical protein
MAEIRCELDDGVEPSDIDHKCDVLLSGESFVEKYNYLIYHFDLDGRYFWARAYIDQIDTVSIYGPFDGRVTRKPLSGAPDEAILAYLKRRFKEIQTLGEEGYGVIWSA